MAEEALELVEPDGARGGGRFEGVVEEGRRMVTRGEGGAGTGQVERVETPRLVGHQLVAFVVAPVERLQRMLEHDGVAGAARRGSHRVLHHVEQLPRRERRRAAQIGALVAAGIGDDEVVAVPPAARRAVADDLRYTHRGRRPAGCVR